MNSKNKSEDTSVFSVSSNEQIENVQSKEKNIVWQQTKVDYEDRCRVLKQKGIVVWFTGLSGSGKSTIAVEVEKMLNEMGRAVYLLDGDNIRHGINKDLGFTKEDRDENIRRISEIAALFQDAGIITLVSFISPFKEMRRFARNKVRENAFVEVYVSTDIQTCMERDPKGLYHKNISNFTGIDSSYDIPENPEIVLDTKDFTPRDCAEKVVEEILNRIQE